MEQHSGLFVFADRRSDLSGGLKCVCIQCIGTLNMHEEYAPHVHGISQFESNTATMGSGIYATGVLKLTQCRVSAYQHVSICEP